MIKVPENVKNNIMAASRQIKIKVQLTIDNKLVDITNDCIQVDITEDKGNTDEGASFGKITYNAVTIKVANYDSKYILDNVNSEYYNKLVTGAKLVITYQIPYILGTEESIYEIPAGIFYVDSWSAKVGQGEATVKAYDILQKQAEEKLKTFDMRQDIHVNDAFKLLFNLMGLKSDQYEIKHGLTTVFDYYWAEGDKFIDCLENVAQAACCNVFVNRYGKIIVEPLGNNKDSCITIKDSDFLFDVDADSSYKDAFCEIEYNNKIAKQLEIIQLKKEENYKLVDGLQTVDVEINNKDKILSISAILFYGGNNISLCNYTISDTGISMNILNGSGEEQQIDIQIWGMQLDVENKITNISIPEAHTQDILKVKSVYPVNEGSVMSNLNVLKEVFTSRSQQITLDVFAIPILELGDIITINSERSGILNTYQINSLTFNFNGALTGEIGVSVVKRVKRNVYTFINPGLIIKQKEE